MNAHAQRAGESASCPVWIKRRKWRIGAVNWKADRVFQTDAYRIALFTEQRLVAPAQHLGADDLVFAFDDVLIPFLWGPALGLIFFLGLRAFRPRIGAGY